MKNTFIKKGYTLAELLVAIGLIIILVGLAIPVVKKKLPESDKEKVKFAYYQLGSVIKSMTTDPYLYSSGTFDNPRYYHDNQKGITFQIEEKFAKALMLRLNVLKVKKMGYEEEWNGVTNTKLKNWKKILGFKNEDGTIFDIKEYTRTCILTNNKIYYCVPTFSKNGTNDRFEDNGNVLVSVYFSEDHSIEKGYYFLVNKEGKISILSDKIPTCFGKASCHASLLADDYDLSGQPIYEKLDNCANPEVYKNFNHCKTYDYLSRVTHIR